MAIQILKIGDNTVTSLSELQCDYLSDIAAIDITKLMHGSTLHCLEGDVKYSLGIDGWVPKSAIEVTTSLAEGAIIDLTSNTINAIKTDIHLDDTTVTNLKTGLIVDIGDQHIVTLDPTQPNKVYAGKLDETSDYRISESPEHYALHTGKAFSISGFMPNVAVGATGYIEIITPNFECSYQSPIFITDKLLRTSIIEAATCTDGTTPIRIEQRHRTSGGAAQTVGYVNPTNVTGGTVIREAIYGNVSGQGNSAIPLPVGEATSINLKPNTKYFISYRNYGNGATTTVYFSCNWFENV